MKLSTLNKGLVLHLPLDKESLQSATQFADKTPYENVGTSANTPVFTTDRMGQTDRAMSFNGSSDCVNCGNDASLDITETITVSAWVNRKEAQSETYAQIAGKWKTIPQNRCYWLTTDNNKFVFYMSHDGSSLHGHAEYTPTEYETWMLITGTFDGTNIKLYENGVLKDTVEYIGGINSEPSDSMVIGGRISGDRIIDGSIADVRIYNRVLSQEEITMLYEQYRPKLVISPTFEFDVNSTQTISGQFSTATGRSVTLDWGDGTSDTYSGTDQAWSHDYGSAVNKTVRMSKSVYLTKFQMDASGANISFDLKDLPRNVTYLYVSGSNTISDYTTPHTWITKPATFHIVPVGAGGLSTVEIDNLLIDLDADLVWSSGNTITLTGTNAARSSASDAAVANMESEGATITTN